MVGMTEDERDDMLAVVTVVVRMDAVALRFILTSNMEELDIKGVAGE
jgi:hypothetical protein